jgi:DNA mismatch endonuclease (patch repair protein)
MGVRWARALRCGEILTFTVERTELRDAAQISRNMSRIRGKNTSIEIRLRRALWAEGFRYRLHVRKLPGTPDIVFFKARLAVFCDSSFWHGRDWEKKKEKLTSNREFWINKIEGNITRDIQVGESLTALGWNFVRFWDIEIEKNLGECVKIIARLLASQRNRGNAG